MKNSRIITLLAALIIAGLFAGCADYATIQWAYPPKQKIPANIKNIAVAKPKDFPARPASGDSLKNMLANKIQNAPGTPFQLIERDDLKGILDQKDFNQSDFVQQKNADPVKLQGIDAIIYAEITGIETKENSHVKVEMQTFSRSEEYYDNKGHRQTRTLNEQRPVQVTVYVHSGTFGATFKLVDVNNAVIYAQLSPTVVKESGEQKSQPQSANNYLAMAMEEAVENYIQEIAPFFKTYQHEIDKTGGPGCRSLKIGEWQVALEQFNQELQRNPNNAGAMYDAAIAYGALGEFDKAIEMADKAFRTKTNPMYSQFKKHVIAVKAEWDRHAAGD
jgi:tetratricopeptide (TPR) repeat protein